MKYVYIYNSYTLIVWTDAQLPKIILETHTEPLCQNTVQQEATDSIYLFTWCNLEALKSLRPEYLDFSATAYRYKLEIICSKET